MIRDVSLTLKNAHFVANLTIVKLIEEVIVGVFQKPSQRSSY